ncbi:MAG: hypothetical protein WKF84_08535 [Pyrinomonadaceae bacterium]
MKFLPSLLAACLLTAAVVNAQSNKPEADETGFAALFDGQSLKGWKLMRGHGPGYVVQRRRAGLSGRGRRQPLH